MYKLYKYDYFLNKKGKIIRFRNQKKEKVKTFTSKSGYIYFHMFNNKENVFIHKAVMKLFGPIRDYKRWQIDHIDRNKNNNCIDNLRWTTPKENCLNK